MRFLPLYVLLFPCWVFTQKLDTLSFYSSSFEDQRSIYVHSPDQYRYQSEQVNLPVFYILDAQHEWFLNPTLEMLRYLQYTHQIPPAILVSIPLKERNKECLFDDFSQASSALHQFITTEVSEKIKAYSESSYRVLTGHSFSASFALYSYLMTPDHYEAVIAHSPLYRMDELMQKMQSNAYEPEKIYLSIGGLHQTKDKYHRQVYDQQKRLYPSLFERLHAVEANSASHNSVPIVAGPILWSQLFEDYSMRFFHIAQIDSNYSLIQAPLSVELEMQKINQVAQTIPLGLAELNGLASKYWNSDSLRHTIAVYELGIHLYPYYFEYYWNLADIHLTLREYKKAAHYADIAIKRLRDYEDMLPEQQSYIQELELLSARAKKKGDP